MRRVIYAWNYHEWGGAQIHLLAIMKEAKKEYEVVVVVPEGSDPQFLSYLEKEGIDYRLFRGHAVTKPVVTWRDRYVRRATKMQSELAMVRAIAGFDLAESIVHIDLLPHSSFLPLAWLAAKTRVFVTSHNAMPPVAAWRNALWTVKGRAISRFRNFNVFCSNEHAKNYFSRHYSAAKTNRIEVTYTSVNPEDIDRVLSVPGSRERMRRQIGLADDDFVVLSVGNFIDRKGRWTLLDAAKRIAGTDEGDKIRFVWLTPTLPNADDLARIEDHGLGERFRLVESASIGKERDAVLSFFRIADAFALPSFVEGLPIALLEAMALGIPSISTNVFAIPEALHDMRTGLLIEAGDDAALAQAVLKYKGDPELARSLAQAGSEYVRANFDDRAVAKKVIAAYKRPA